MPRNTPRYTSKLYSLRFTPETAAWLEREAARQGRTTLELVRYIVEKARTEQEQKP